MGRPRHHKGRTKELSDSQLIALAWREPGKQPNIISPGCIRACYPGRCPRCEKPIAVGQEIHRVRDHHGYVHLRCRRPAEVLESGRPHTVTVRRMSTVPNICGECHLEHAGECP